MKTRWMENQDASNKDIRDEILRMLLMLQSGESICPSDAARSFGSKWREIMPAVREVAADMVRDGSIEVIQKGEIVDIDQRDIESIKGPIRLRLVKRPKPEPIVVKRVAIPDLE
jgi:hypothetical protein